MTAIFVFFGALIVVISFVLITTALSLFCCCVVFLLILDLYFCCVCLFLVFFFFFKQKTAYEMRISDWSSDVCSSDLRYDRSRTARLFRCSRHARVLPPYRSHARRVHAREGTLGGQRPCATQPSRRHGGARRGNLGLRTLGGDRARYGPTDRRRREGAGRRPRRSSEAHTTELQYLI